MEDNSMGIVREEITLKNAGDIARLAYKNIKEQEVRQVTLQAVVDTGAITLVITEDVCKTLGLFIRETKKVRLADGQWREFKVTEPVEIIWKNRTTACNAYVVPGGNVLLGAIPLEGMDLIVNPKTQKLEGEHGDEPIALLL
jgi:clan AA aspartic protease